MKPINLHVVSWNRPDMTELVLRTIQRNTKRANYRVTVLDNGSEIKTIKRLTDLGEQGFIDDLIAVGENKGLEWARQHLLDVATDSHYFICVDNDCLPPPIDEHGRDWIERLVDLMEKYEDFGAISCRTQVMIGTGNIFEEADQVGDEIVMFPHPGGSLRIMRTDAVRKVGGWASDRPGRGAEERLICGKLNEAGYRTAFAVDIECLHLFGTRGKKGTDRWGYDKELKPEDTGHSDISHPALTNGDDFDEVEEYAGRENTERYYA